MSGMELVVDSPRVVCVETVTGCRFVDEHVQVAGLLHKPRAVLGAGHVCLNGTAADLRGDLLSGRRDLSLLLAELATAFLEALGAGNVSVAPQLSDLFRQIIDLSSEIVTFAGDATALLVEFGDLSEITQGTFIAPTGE